MRPNIYASPRVLLFKKTVKLQVVDLGSAYNTGKGVERYEKGEQEGRR